MARGDGDAESDVDLLYVLKDGEQLGFALFEIEDDLARLFARPVALVSRKAVNRHLWASIESDAGLLYAARPAALGEAVSQPVPKLGKARW